MHRTLSSPTCQFRLTASLMVLSVLAVVACSSDTSTSPSVPGVISAARVADTNSPVAEAAQGVARAIALAFGDPLVRGQVRDAMRASLVDEHKLVLQSFVQTASGQSMLKTAARRSRVPLKTIETQIASLPALDFYMPIRAHRQSWNGGDDVLVVATLDRKGPFVGYTASGTAVPLAGKTRDQLEPLFMLHPSEPAGLRVHPQAATPGSVVEDANDGAGSESITWAPANGTPVTVDLADPNAQQELAKLAATIAAGTKTGGDFVVRPDACTCEDCPEQDGCGPPPPPPQPTDTTLIREYSFFFCDDEECWTNLEIRITAVYMTAGGVEIGRAVYHRGDVNPHSWYTVNAPLIFQRIQEGSGQYMIMNLVEEDGFGNNDDWCGDLVVDAAHNDQTIHYPNTSDCYANPHSLQNNDNSIIRYYWTPKF